MKVVGWFAAGRLVPRSWLSVALASTVLAAGCGTSTPTATPPLFPQEAAWIGESDRMPLYEGGADLPWMIDDAIRTSAAVAGRLAAEAGYEITPRSQWEIAADGTVQRFLGPFSVPSKMVVALRSYSDARLRYFRKLRALRRLEAEKSARDARIEAEVARESAILPATTLWSNAAKTTA